jgi:hypothetical protein
MPKLGEDSTRKIICFQLLEKVGGLHRLLRGNRRMTLRIERISDDQKSIFRLSGRIESEHLVELRAEIEGMGAGTVLDLEHVTLVDVEGVRLLSDCEFRGVELVHCSPYIREWIARERNL